MSKNEKMIVFCSVLVSAFVFTCSTHSNWITQQWKSHQSWDRFKGRRNWVNSDLSFRRCNRWSQRHVAEWKFIKLKIVDNEQKRQSYTTVNSRWPIWYRQVQQDQINRALIEYCRVHPTPPWIKFSYRINLWTKWNDLNAISIVIFQINTNKSANRFDLPCIWHWNCLGWGNYRLTLIAFLYLNWKALHLLIVMLVASILCYEKCRQVFTIYVKILMKLEVDFTVSLLP